MNKTVFTSLLIVITTVLAVQDIKPANGEVLKPPVNAPEFTHTDATDWINSDPLTLKQLSGKVILVDFWTFDCWNCYRSFPWLNAMEDRIPHDNFQIVGVHSPEFSHEKIRDNVVAKVKEFKLRHPVMIDNDFSYWKAMYNKYWPAFYLIDKKGLIRGIYYGETHAGDPQAKHIEKMINVLLSE